MRTVRLDSLLSQVRARAFIEASTTVITDAEITEFINQSFAEMLDEIVLQNQDYNVTSTTLNTVAGTATASLPSDFYKFRKLVVTIDGQMRTLSEFRLEEIEDYANVTSGWTVGIPISYRRYGTSVLFAPTPQAVHAVTMYYLPCATRLVSASDTFDGQDGWEEFVVLDAARKCLDKLDRDSGKLTQERDRKLAFVVKMASAVNYGEPPMMVRKARTLYPWRPQWRRPWSR